MITNMTELDLLDTRELPQNIKTTSAPFGSVDLEMHCTILLLYPIIIIIIPEHVISHK